MFQKLAQHMLHVRHSLQLSHQPAQHRPHVLNAQPAQHRPHVLNAQPAEVALYYRCILLPVQHVLSARAVNSSPRVSRRHVNLKPYICSQPKVLRSQL